MVLVVPREGVEPNTPSSPDSASSPPSLAPNGELAAPAKHRLDLFKIDIGRNG
jgi:hypothetical protein